jgi:hypothetical protein
MKKILALMIIVGVFSAGLIVGTAADGYCGNAIRAGRSIKAGQFLRSENGKFMASMQSDGNFVIYRLKPVWSTNTRGSHAVRMDLQGDGNLVLYDRYNQAEWDSGTSRPGRRGKLYLMLNNKGNLVIYNRRRPIWSSREGRIRRR